MSQAGHIIDTGFDRAVQSGAMLGMHAAQLRNMALYRESMLNARERQLDIAEQRARTSEDINAIRRERLSLEQEKATSAMSDRSRGLDLREQAMTARDGTDEGNNAAMGYLSGSHPLPEPNIDLYSQEGMGPPGSAPNPEFDQTIQQITHAAPRLAVMAANKMKAEHGAQGFQRIFQALATNRDLSGDQKAEMIGQYTQGMDPGALAKIAPWILGPTPAQQAGIDQRGQTIQQRGDIADRTLQQRGDIANQGFTLRKQEDEQKAQRFRDSLAARGRGGSTQERMMTNSRLPDLMAALNSPKTEPGLALAVKAELAKRGVDPDREQLVEGVSAAQDAYDAAHQQPDDRGFMGRMFSNAPGSAEGDALSKAQKMLSDYDARKGQGQAAPQPSPRPGMPVPQAAPAMPAPPPAVNFAPASVQVPPPAAQQPAAPPAQTGQINTDLIRQLHQQHPDLDDPAILKLHDQILSGGPQ